MAQSNLLLLFVRKPELGKVKTRLAIDLGEEKALAIYMKLLEHTRAITHSVESDKIVYYAGEVQENDLWDNTIYQKQAQPEGDLGYKMEQAFMAGFEKGYSAVVIIGSDCHELDQHIIEQAFSSLKEHDVVIGPAKDGGYYLLGMRTLHLSLFRNKHWSTSSVFSDTLADLQQHNLTYKLLPVLSDVDHATDVKAAWLT